MKTFLAVLLIFGSSFTAYSQNIETKFSANKLQIKEEPFSKRNTVGVDANLYYLYGIGLIGSSINYERYVDKNLYLRTGIGYYLLAGSDTGYAGYQIPLSLNLIIGKRNNHFEVDFGGRIIFDNLRDDIDYWSKPFWFYPIFNIGYRYQNPTGGIIFKALVGIDGLTLGVGYAF